MVCPWSCQHINSDAERDRQVCPESLALLKYVAIYTLAYKISSSLKLVLVDTIKLAIFPQMIRRIDSPDNKRFYLKAMLYSSYVVMFALLACRFFT